jgi:acyl carrier protein
MNSQISGIREQLRHFVTDNFLFGEADGAWSDQHSFLEKGIIDSTGVLELTHFLDEHFGIAVADEELVPDNLDSVDNLVRFIESKKAKAA